MKSKTAYKIDKYSIFKKSNDSTEIFSFNFRNGALARLNSSIELEQTISNGKTDNFLFISQNLDFVANYMLPEHLEETMLVQQKFRQQQELESELNLTILTTLACNFSCYYCYEQRENVHLQEIIENKIIDLIKERLGKLEKIALCWYGGEPLLVQKSIEKINKLVNDLCEKHEIIFGSKIVTNTYLLNPTVSESLHLSGIQEVQVSLDGPKHLHDKIRHQNGKPTFDTILDNITYAKDKFNIIIRVNVSNENKHEIFKLLTQLKEKKIHTFCTIYFANLHSNGTGCSDMSEQQLNGLINTSDFISMSLEYKKIALNKGFKIRTPLSTTTLCSAVTKGGFVIEPNGNIKKCYLDVSNNDEQIANVQSDLNSFIENDNIKELNNKWINYDPFSHKDCKDCHAMPICFSGCPWEAMRNVPTNERCHPLKMGLYDYFDFFFNSIDQGAIFDPIKKTLQKSII